LAATKARAKKKRIDHILALKREEEIKSKVSRHHMMSKK
jgi:hypothetical protein